MNPNADIKKYQEIACKDPYHAYLFALGIPDADIVKCQKAACKDSYCAYAFVKDIPGANINYYLNYCLEDINKDSVWYYKLLVELPQIIAKQSV